ncbi:Galactomannan galactosyltransferase 1 [Linum grandiflorum]
MAKSTRNKNSPLSNDCCLYIEGSLFAFLFFWCHWSYAGPSVSNRDDHNFIPRVFGEMGSDRCSNPTPILRFDPPDTTFYDDLDLRYSIDKKITGWDDKRKEWLKQNPTFSAVEAAKHRVVMVTGSQLKPCRNPIGDYLLLRAFKNKVDYYWIHRIDIFYNNVLLHPKMPSFWVKLPVVKAAMVAHPEVEWI